MLSPDVYEDVVDFQVRWLVSNHLTMDEKDLPQCVSPELRKFFERYLLEENEVVEEPVTPSPPPRPLEERIRLFLNSARQCVSADTIAESIKADVEGVKEALRELNKTRVVEKGRVKGSAEDIYWLSKFGFKPSKNIIGEVLIIPMRITQVEASKKAKSMMEGGLFGKKEEIYDAEFSHIPIWRVSATREVKRLFFKKQESDTYYFSAQTGALVSLEKKEMVFHKLVTKGLENLKDLDDDEDITFVQKLPSEVEKFPEIRIKIDRIYRKLQRTLGVKPVSAEIILLPMWTLKVRHKKTLAKRTIILDAATCRTISGHFQA